jgi:hypothetical protein
MTIRLTSRTLKRIWTIDVGDIIDESTWFIKGKVAAFLRSQYARIPDLEMTLLDADGRIRKVVHRKDGTSPA